MLVLPLRPDAEELARRALAGGVDAVQLREPSGAPEEIAQLARRLGPVCRERGVLFVVSGSPALARRAGADGVHVEAGEPPTAGLLTGRSVTTAGELPDPAADYLFVGPVFATPTKPGQPPVGLELVREAAALASVPFFAVGGIDLSNVASVVAAGARRVAVVRAVASAADPEAAARALRAALPR
jgi:thiamine-phosphate pyrophosphorylase